MSERETQFQSLKFSEFNYNSYLKIKELLDLQKPVSKPLHHDEIFFIIIHQASELWFKEILHETTLLKKAFQDISVSRALKGLRRLSAIMELLVKQINLLSTLTPVEFAGFRDQLKPASGFQSVQFREIEFVYGIRNEFFLNFFASQPELLNKFKKISTEATVYDEFLSCLARSKFPIPNEILKRDVSKQHVSNEALAKVLKGIYENPGEDFHWVLLFESLLDFDEKFSAWRLVHMLMIERTIGMKKGSGGSAGFKFLETRMSTKLFPELWDLRNLIGTNY